MDYHFFKSTYMPYFYSFNSDVCIEKFDLSWCFKWHSYVRGYVLNPLTAHLSFLVRVTTCLPLKKVYNQYTGGHLHSYRAVNWIQIKIPVNYRCYRTSEIAVLSVRHDLNVWWHLRVGVSSLSRSLYGWMYESLYKCRQGLDCFSFAVWAQTSSLGVFIAFKTWLQMIDTIHDSHSYCFPCTVHILKWHACLQDLF